MKSVAEVEICPQCSLHVCQGKGCGYCIGTSKNAPQDKAYVINGKEYCFMCMNDKARREGERHE